jgi:hypothetical protein
MFFAYAQSFHPSGDLGFIQLSYLFRDPVIWNIISVLQLLYMPFVVVYERRKLNLKMLRYFVTNWVYNLTWIPIAVWGLVTHKKTDWSHTEHIRNVSMDELS